MEVYNENEEIEFANACTEILEIFKYLNKNDFEKIPQSTIHLFEINANKNHKFIYNLDEEFEKQQISKKTKELLAVLFAKYWATEKQKNKIEKYDIQYLTKVESEKSKKYNYYDIFKKENIEEVNAKDDSLEENLPINYKRKNIFMKLFENIKKFLNVKI